MASAQYNYEDYTIGWVCALPNEQAAALFMLDDKHDDLPNPSGDHNAYTLGSIGKHKVVIAGLPKGRYGNTSSATVASRMVSTFPNIKFGLMVGIGGGIPQKTRLGDVVISCPTATEPGVVQWDMGKAEHSGTFRRTGSLAPPPTALLTALSKFEAEQMTSRAKMLGYLDDMRWMPNVRKSFLKSESLKDVLYESGYSHISGDDCTQCDPNMVVQRETREDDLMIHCGLIASGNQVIKDADLRDRLYQNFDSNLLCVEMEAAGLMNDFPCIVIRGISDYADSHKNEKWQDYAAAVAAACAKAYLTVVPAGEVDKLQRVQVSITPNVFKGAKNLVTGIWDKQNIFTGSTATGPQDGAEADRDGTSHMSAPATTRSDKTQPGANFKGSPDAKPTASGPDGNSPMKTDLESWLREASSSLAKMVKEGQVEAAMSNLLVALNQLQVSQKGRSTPQAVHPGDKPQTPPLSPRGVNNANEEFNGCAEDPHGFVSRKSSCAPVQSPPAYRYTNASTQTWPLEDEQRNMILTRSQTFPNATRVNHAAVPQLTAQALPQAFPPLSPQPPPYTNYDSGVYDGEHRSVQKSYYPAQTPRPPVRRGESVPVNSYGKFHQHEHNARVLARGHSLDDGAGGFQVPYANGYVSPSDRQMHPGYSRMPPNMNNAQQHTSGHFHHGRGYGPVEWNHGNTVNNQMAQGHSQGFHPQYQYAPEPGYDTCTCEDCYDDYTVY